MLSLVLIIVSYLQLQYGVALSTTSLLTSSWSSSNILLSQQQSTISTISVQVQRPNNIALPIQKRTRTPITSCFLVQQNQQQQHTKFVHTVEYTTTTLSSSSSSLDDSEVNNDNSEQSIVNKDNLKSTSTSLYNLGIGKNRPLDINNNNTATSNDNIVTSTTTTTSSVAEFWKAPVPLPKSEEYKLKQRLSSGFTKSSILRSTNNNNDNNNTYTSIKPFGIKQHLRKPIQSRRMIARDNESQILRKAMWDENHYNNNKINRDTIGSNHDNVQVINQRERYQRTSTRTGYEMGLNAPKRPRFFYPNIDLSIPNTVYTDDGQIDLVWDLLRWEAYQNQRDQQEPLLVSFLHSTILNHPTLESSLAFLLANRLQSPAIMISTQIQSLVQETLTNSPSFRRMLRADIMAVRDRDPACNTLPDVFLYFKGFHALQSHRVAHCLWCSGRQVLAQFIQSQVSQIFQIDIHPNATLGSGIMLDHGTGIVIGETAVVGHNCSILHHVTLGGSGKTGVVRHPSIGNGVLLGAGASIVGPVTVGDCSQVGAGTLVISDLPAHCVAVGVPARIIGSFIDVTEQPSIGMNQLMDDTESIRTFTSDGI